MLVKSVQTLVNLSKLNPLQAWSRPHILQHASGWTPSKVPNIDVGALSILNRVSLANEQNETGIKVTVVVVLVIVVDAVLVIVVDDVVVKVVETVVTVVVIVVDAVDVILVVVVSEVVIDVRVVVGQGVAVIIGGYMMVGRIIIFCLIPE